MKAMAKSVSKTANKTLKREYELSIREIPCLCHIGILPDERIHEQPLFVSAQLRGDFHKVASKGDLFQGVDYSILQHDYQQILKTARFYLIETAAFALCQWTLWRFKSISQAQISITKPHALMGQGVPEIRCTLAQKKLKVSRIIKTPEIEIYDKVPKGKSSTTSRIHQLTLSDGRLVYAICFSESLRAL